MLNGLMALIFFICVAMLFNEGLWSNAITLVNAVTAALLATNYWEPLAAQLDKMEPSYTYVWDILAIWLLFAVSFLVLRAFTDQVSKVRVRFRKPVEIGGSVFFAAWTGWVMVCFTMMTLHTAPLAKNFLSGAFNPDEKMILGFAPDHKWLGFMHTMSKDGAFAQSASEKTPDATVFDPQGDFILRYADRRARFETEPETRVIPGK